MNGYRTKPRCKSIEDTSMALDKADNQVTREFRSTLRTTRIPDALSDLFVTLFLVGVGAPDSRHYITLKVAGRRTRAIQ
jgi:hypothetical protein